MNFNNGDFWSLLQRLIQELTDYYNEQPNNFKRGFAKVLKFLSFIGLVASITLTVFLIIPFAQLIHMGIEPKLYWFIAFAVLICSYTIYTTYISFKDIKTFLA